MRMKYSRQLLIHYSLINAPVRASKGILVPVTGLEPVRCYHRGILSPLRLPISPHRQNLKISGRNSPLHSPSGNIIVDFCPFVNKKRDFFGQSITSAYSF